MLSAPGITSEDCRSWRGGCYICLCRCYITLTKVLHLGEGDVAPAKSDTGLVATQAECLTLFLMFLWTCILPMYMIHFLIKYQGSIGFNTVYILRYIGDIFLDIHLQ